MTSPGSHLVSVTTGHRDEKPVIPLNLPNPPAVLSHPPSSVDSRAHNVAEERQAEWAAMSSLQLDRGLAKQDWRKER
ncbi:hypothetical protein CTRI78_v007736 [Colletotrichum trifolii]|uniref:Uncharacterized protein n=1 Tax=Colletotrichum trifolii TaxID=5466 RepID=A0A4V3HUW5_COLTR|nr:hypothetical protein CTRI78_v007736 [Colletotrichum trifolii]